MVLDLESFYRDRKVLVTGHTGFKGSWLTIWLKALGADVIGYSLPADKDRQNLFQAAHVESSITHIEADIRDANALNAAFLTHHPEIIFHLAAQPLVRRSYKRPVDTYSTNVMGTVHVLDAARRSPTSKAVVAITTDKCYENRESIDGYRENDRLGGFDPYSSSKACAELVAEAFRNSYFHQRQIGVATARAGNVIGGGDWAEDRLVPDFVRAITTDRPIVVRNPGAVRPWQHVLEPLYGYLFLGQKLSSDWATYSSPWNFGPRQDAHISVKQVAEKLITSWGAGEILFQKESDSELHETNHLALDCTKACTKLGWQPSLSVDEAIQATATWYREFYANPNRAASLTQNQIKRYQQMLQHSADNDFHWTRDRSAA